MPSHLVDLYVKNYDKMSHRIVTTRLHSYPEKIAHKVAQKLIGSIRPNRQGSRYLLRPVSVILKRGDVIVMEYTRGKPAV